MLEIKNCACPSLSLSSVCSVALAHYANLCQTSNLLLFPGEILLSEQVSPVEAGFGWQVSGIQAACGYTGHEGHSAPSIIGFFFFLDFGESAWVNEA